MIGQELPFITKEFKPIDPLEFASVMWPDVYFYKKQREIIYSVEENNITVVPACNMVGKDFVAGYIALSTFLRYPVCRVITTSVSDDHLRVLWAEIYRYIDSCKFPLRRNKGGCLKVNHRDVIKTRNGEECRISYLRGKVSEKGEGLAGHHAPHTLAIIDEASGVDDIVLTQMETWAKRILIIGNPLPCVNFFHRFVEEGDIPALVQE